MDAEVARRRGQAGDGTATSTAQLYTEQYGAAKTGTTKAKADEPAAVPTDFFGRVRVPMVGKSSMDEGACDVDGELSPDSAQPKLPGVRIPPPHPHPAFCFSTVQESTTLTPAKVLPQADRVKFRAVYRFNEGSSSAVRTNVKMSALM